MKKLLQTKGVKLTSNELLSIKGGSIEESLEVCCGPSQPSKCYTVSGCGDKGGIDGGTIGKHCCQ